MTIETDEQQPEGDAFTAAFDQLAALDSKAPTEAVPEPKAEEPVVEEPKAEEPVVEEPKVEEPAAEAPEPKVEEPAAKSDDADAILERLSKLVKEAPEPKAEPAPKVEEPAAAPPIYTDDEQAILTAYEKDWADVSRAESLKRRAEYRDVVQYIFQEIAKELNPIKEMATTVAERTHLSDLQTKVTGYDDGMREQIISWVDQQPTYLQAAYKQVIQQGTVDEVVDLVERFRKDTGASPKPAAPSPEPELSNAAKQAAAALAPVSSKRSVVPTQDDPSDFGAAFAKFADIV